MRRVTVNNNPVTSALFWGYSAELIAHWCRVSLSTARAYKHGQAKPSPRSIRLFDLHQDRQIIPAEWGRGWALTASSIVTPEGIEIPRTWLRGYQQLIEWAHCVAQTRGLSAEYQRRLAALAEPCEGPARSDTPPASARHLHRANRFSQPSSQTYWQRYRMIAA
jgi:hypothetical protein